MTLHDNTGDDQMTTNDKSASSAGPPNAEAAGGSAASNPPGLIGADGLPLTGLNSPIPGGDELPGVANLEPPPGLFTAPEPEKPAQDSAADGSSDGSSDKDTPKTEEPRPESRGDSATGRDSTEDSVVTQAAPISVDQGDWRDVDDDPWQADEDAPPPVIGY